MKRTLSILLCAVLLVALCACAGRNDSTVTALVFRDADIFSEALADTADASGESLSSTEIESLLTGDAFRELEGFLSLNADGTLNHAELIRQQESGKGDYMLIRTMVSLYPNALPYDEFDETCTVYDTPVDASRQKLDGAVCYTAAFVRPDTGVAVRATEFCDPSEGDRREDCIRRLWALTEACLNPENTLTLDSVYSGPDFPRRAETALVPISLETEAALRAGAREALERYQATAAIDPAIPAESVCDAMRIRAVSPGYDEMLVDADMAYRPAQWEWGNVDDGYRFENRTVPGWYSGQPFQHPGEGARADWLVGTQSFLIQRGADGEWQVFEGGPGGPVKYWVDDEHDYDTWIRVRWTG